MPDGHLPLATRHPPPATMWRALITLLFVPILVLGLMLVDRLALRSIPGALSRSDESGFTSEQALGRVLALRAPATDAGSATPRLRNLPYQWQLMACQVLSGAFAGRVVLCNQLVHPNPEWNIVVRPGDTVVLELAARGKAITWASPRKPALRHRELLWLLGAMFLALLAFGGWRSARNSLGVAGIVVVLVGGLFPLLKAGAPPLPAMAGFAAIVVGGVLLLFYGWDRKALAALAGTAGALIIVVVVTAAASHGLKLTGLDTPGSRYLVELWQHGRIRFDYHALLLSGLLVAVVGVAIDTSVSIAAGIEELYKAHPAIDRRAAFASGLAIGRDVMGVCATTFVFASVGVRLPVLLCPAAADLAPAELVNTEAGCIEVVRLLACGIGLLATAPLTTLCAVAIFSRPRAEGGEREPSLARARAVLMVEALALGGLFAAVLHFQPHRPVPRPSFSSLRQGTFQAVAGEANALLEGFDYPRAILLLWEAQARGIGGLRPHFVLADLYRDYLAYIQYQEQEGMPAKVRERWARTSAEGAGRAWMLHRIGEFQAALAREPADARAHQALGRLLCQVGRAADAVPHFRAALEAEPDDVEVLCDLAAAFTMVGEPERADPIARRLEQLAPDSPRVRQLLERLEPAPRP